MPLTIVQAGRCVRLQGISAGRGLRGRLEAMGLVPGVEIEVLQNTGQGPFVIAVKGCRLILGRNVGHHIMVG